MVDVQSILQGDFHVECIHNLPVSSNCYVVHQYTEKNCIIVDPGSQDSTLLIEYLIKHNLSPQFIIFTHEHFDHIWGVVELSKIYNFILICSNPCSLSIVNPKKNLSFFWDNVGFSIEKNCITTESLNNELKWNNKDIKFYATPGHSDGSICIKLDNILFCGDLFINYTLTITKLPGGSSIKFNNSFTQLKEILYPDTYIYSGHGKSFYFKDYFLYNTL